MHGLQNQMVCCWNRFLWRPAPAVWHNEAEHLIHITHWSFQKGPFLLGSMFPLPSDANASSVIQVRNERSSFLLENSFTYGKTAALGSKGKSVFSIKRRFHYSAAKRRMSSLFLVASLLILHDKLITIIKNIKYFIEKTPRIKRNPVCSVFSMKNTFRRT